MQIITILLAVTLYNPPQIVGLQASNVLHLYIVAVLAYYGLKESDIAGNVSDAGSDIRRCFEKVCLST
jgi:hypothetical protein